MNNRIRLIKSFAGYPVGEYILMGAVYINAQGGKKADGRRYIVGQYKIHPDIVQRAKDCFEGVEKLPMPAVNKDIDWSGVMKQAEYCLTEEGKEDDDSEHYLYEEVLEAVYGKEVRYYFKDPI